MIKIWSGSHLAPLADNHVRRQVALTCNIQSVSSYIFTKVGHAVADYALMRLKYPLMCLNFPNPDNHVSRQVALT